MAAPVAGPAPAVTDQTPSLENLIQQITTPTVAPSLLAHTLRTFAAVDIRETILASLLPGGQDPLALLDPSANTLGFLYLLSARLTAGSVAAPVEPAHIERFCGSFDPEQARYAPERITLLARGIARVAEASHRPKYAIEPLHHLLTRFPPSLAHLTPLHPLFVSLCLKNQHTPPALLLPILSTPITHVSKELFPDLHYNDNLIYHYAGGLIFGGWKHWADAEELLEIVVGSPAQMPSALQWDALKKLVLVQCIAKGKALNLPKYVHPTLSRLLKTSPYGAFVKAYPRQMNQLKELVEKEKDTFASDRNTGLIKQALEAAPRWNIARLTSTYLTLGLAEIGAAVGIANEEEVRGIVLSMIEKDEITATLSADGTVTFSDPPVAISRTEVDTLLREAQAQGAFLASLERELAGSKEFLTKAVKSKEDGERWAMGGSMDEEMMQFGAGVGGAGWTEETLFG